MLRKDLTDRIKPPTFKVGRYVLNEYEAREMVARIAEGTLSPEGLKITDEKGKTVTIDGEGTMSDSIYNWDIGSRKSMRRVKAVFKRRKE